MKARAGTIDLAPATKWLAGLSGALHAMPALSGIRVEAHEGGLTLAATDLDRWATVHMEADVGEPGVTLVSAAKLSQVVGAMRPGGVDLTLADDRLRLDGLGSRATLRTIEEADWPGPPEAGEGAAQVTMHAKVLAALVPKVVPFAAKPKDAGDRIAQSGVSLEVGADGLIAAATDRYRLAVARVDGGASGEGAAVCPATALQEAVKALGSGAEEAAISVSDGEVAIRLDSGWSLRSRTLAGRFPDWRQAMPERGAFETAVDAEAEELAIAVKAVIPAADERTDNPHATLRIDPSDGVTVTAGGQGDEAEAEARGAEVEGEGLSITFNARYLLDAITACGSHRVRLEMRDERKPALVVPPDSDKYDTLLMPIRL